MCEEIIMPPRIKYDWLRLETEYVQGYFETQPNGIRIHRFPSYQELADKYEYHKSVIAKRASAENWLLQRDQYKEKVKGKIERENNSIRFRDSARYDVQNLRALEDVHKLVDKYFENYTDLLESEAGFVLNEEGEAPKINVKELQMIVDIIDKKHRIARNIFGEPINAEKLHEEAKNEITIKPKASDVRDMKKLAALINTRQEDREKQKAELHERQARLEAELVAENNVVKEEV